jgi:hypothetical protein
MNLKLIDWAEWWRKQFTLPPATEQLGKHHASDDSFRRFVVKKPDPMYQPRHLRT